MTTATVEGLMKLADDYVELANARFSLRSTARIKLEAYARALAAPTASGPAEFAGWFQELPSGMSYRLWEQGGHDWTEGDVALYVTAPRALAAPADSAPALQARIDELMMEYCPDEMTPEQITIWASHQRVVSPAMQKEIDAAIAAPRAPAPDDGTTA